MIGEERARYDFELPLAKRMAQSNNPALGKCASQRLLIYGHASSAENSPALQRWVSRRPMRESRRDDRTFEQSAWVLSSLTGLALIETRFPSAEALGYYQEKPGIHALASRELLRLAWLRR